MTTVGRASLPYAAIAVRTMSAPSSISLDQHYELDPLVIAGRTFGSRLVVGTGKYPSHAVMADAHAPRAPTWSPSRCAA